MAITPEGSGHIRTDWRKGRWARLLGVLLAVPGALALAGAGFPGAALAGDATALVGAVLLAWGVLRALGTEHRTVTRRVPVEVARPGGAGTVVDLGAWRTTRRARGRVA